MQALREQMPKDEGREEVMTNVKDGLKMLKTLSKGELEMKQGKIVVNIIVLILAVLIIGSRSQAAETKTNSAVLDRSQLSAPVSEVDPEAIQVLRRATDYLAVLKQFRAESDMTMEYVLMDGQKLQFGHRISVAVQRPNKIRSERVGDLVEQAFYYDGKSLSVALPKEKYYATVAAPPTIDEMLDFARDKLNVIAPASDLFYLNAFERLTEGLTSAIIVGPASVAGVVCDHLAFRNEEVDWQIWIEQGKEPLVRKFVVTSKKMPQSPQFMVTISKWDTAPKLVDAVFSFVPPKNSMKIDILPATTAGNN